MHIIEYGEAHANQSGNVFCFLIVVDERMILIYSRPNLHNYQLFHWKAIVETSILH